MASLSSGGWRKRSGNWWARAVGAEAGRVPWRSASRCVPAATKMQTDLQVLADIAAKEVACVKDKKAAQDSLAAVAALEEEVSEGAKVIK